MWILLAMAAAAFQTLRFMLQRQLSLGALSPGGATLARFLYAAPIVAALVAGYLVATGGPLPRGAPIFWIYVITGGLAQILATWCVVALFSRRNFAVGIAFKKTETVQTALIGLVVLGDRISAPGVVAILLGLVGVLILSDMPRTGPGPGAVWRRLANPAAALGLASGTLFAVSAVGYRGATLAIASPDPILRAGLTLAVVTAMQSVGLSLWLAWRDPGQVGRVIAAYRAAIWIGLCGMAGSLCLFIAFAQQNAAMVFAVSQVEVIFSLAASILIFGERLSLKEAGGIALVTLSVIGVVILR